MGFDTSGYVLKSARSAPSNARTTAASDSGVLRHHADLPGSYSLLGDLVEVSADQYRSGIIENPILGTQEYLLWAANSSNLAVLEDPSWAIVDGSGAIPAGTLTVTDTFISGTRDDGTDRVVITDGDDRSITSILSITILRGDLDLEFVITTFASTSPDAGLVFLDAGALTLLGGGVSQRRGDAVTAVSYTLAGQKFWWTRNDSYVSRFGWNGITQRWEPFKGSPPVNLGRILEDEEYTLTPRPSRFSVGDMLPGDLLLPDSYAMVRVGIRPDAISTPVRVLVVVDEEATTAYLFPVGVDAVVGATAGVLIWNPTFVAAYAGQVAWYLPETFDEESVGILGPLKGADVEPLFISPIPEVTDYPMIRIGSRRLLQAIQADTDADLALLTVNEGEVGWSRATGLLKFSTTDVAKADPDNVGFELLYLDAVVVYAGVAMSTTSIGTRTPVQLVDDTGTPTTVDGTKDLFIPLAVPLPSPGTSGITHVPDGTGIVPNTSVTPTTRPNGSGLIRKITGVGDSFLFGKQGAIESISQVEFEDDLPEFTFKIRKGQAYVARELNTSGAGSKVALGRKDRQKYDGEPLYFLQAEVQPAIFAGKARLGSRGLEPFILEGTEVLAFAVDGTNYLWNASLLGPGTFTAAVVATSINSVITGSGQVVASNGRVWIEAGSLSTGSVEIGFGSTTSGAFVDRDLSGCAVLGFLPGWRVDDPSTNTNWLPDGGLGFGVYRSPQNLDRSQDKADMKARGRFTDFVLSNGVIASPIMGVTNPPLIDVAGYDEGVFFQTVDGIYRRTLGPFEDVLYQFEDSKFAWLEEGSITAVVDVASDALLLGNQRVVGSTLHPAVGNGYGLYVGLDGTAKVLQVQGTDYLLPDGGGQGIAVLITPVGAQTAVGARGSFTAATTTFTDLDATFLTDGVAPGYQLKILSGSDSVQGSYIVASVTSETSLNVEATVPFAETASMVSWEIHGGFTDAVFDPGLVADVVYEQFNHLPTEPFTIRALSNLGATPANAAAQALGRLKAVAVEALANGRPIRVRFGRDAGSDEAVLTALVRTLLGTMANNLLAVPSTLDEHFTTAAFSIQVGATSYTIGTNLTGVPAFTVPLPGDQIQYGNAGAIEGQLNFGEDTLANLAGSFVYFVQEFLDPSDLAVGEAEIAPTSGQLNLSDADMAAHGGETAYFVEQMITENQLDVVISPVQGTVYFKRPLRANQIIEVSYTQADSSGNQVNTTPITERLPLFVSLEEATFVTTVEYSFNPTSRTVRGDIETQVWVNNRLMNYGNVAQCTVDPSTNIITFVDPVASGSTVRINYAVEETFGGEATFTVSAPPVYRPPFFLQVGQNTFTLQTDRTGDVVPGMFLRLGAQPFYIEDSSYDAGTDTTSVTVFPTPALEAGSRAPGNDVLTLLSSVPVATSVNGNPTTGAVGFLLTLSAEFDPVDKGMLSINFRGDVTAFSVAGHLLEVSGYPLLIVGSELSDDGLTTRVDVSSPMPRAFEYPTNIVKVSARPVYPPAARNFLGLGPLVGTEPVEVVLFGETDLAGTLLPGRSLSRDIEYSIDGATGSIALLEPRQAPLGPDQKLFVYFTKRRTVRPFLLNGSLILPLYSAKYVYVTVPTEENGFLDASVLATYTFSSPDSFYVRAAPLLTYMGEVAQLAVSRVAGRTPHGGPIVTTGPRQDNWTFGTVPLTSEIRELRDQDRAARAFIILYNEFVLAFEQVNETIRGDVVGDRDGKFRFFVGQGKTYTPPGYEDDITGLIEPRLVWSLVFESANESFGVTTDDPVVEPESAVQDPTTKVVSGDPMNPWLLDFYVRMQDTYVLNDMDDIVLAGKGRTKLQFLFSFEVKGDFRQMWEPSVVSRLFPEATLAFTTTYPGLLAGTLPSDPGVYAFLKLLEKPRLLKGEGPVFGSTFGMDIGSVENPALGLITGITGQVKPRERLPRARIWGYSATGYPDLDALYGSSTSGKPTILATPLFLKDFPIDPETGLPDLSQLTAQGGDLPDLTTGDVELSTPKWVPFDDEVDVSPQVAFGRPTGETYAVGFAGQTITKAFGGGDGLEYPTPIYGGVFVYEVQAGCFITFGSVEGGSASEITNSSDIIGIDADGTSTLTFEPVRGDTVYVIPPTSQDASEFSDPPTTKELKKFAKNQPFLDVGVRERRSAFVDRSLPSFEDPSFPIKEIVNQKTASPLQCIEADVEFQNVMRDPLEFPALLGLPTNDSGDYGIPYLSTTNTELDRLGAVQGVFISILQTDSPLPSAVYPDEVLGNDGDILAAALGSIPPATLISTRDFTPVTTAGVYTPHSGIGDTRPFDLLLMEVGQAGISVGATGILSVGAVSTNRVEIPRFVTQSKLGDRIRYVFNNAMVHLSSTGLSGMTVTEVGPNTRFDIPTVAGLHFNNGSGAVAGGLNNIFSTGADVWPLNDNLITIRLISQATGLVVETITFATGFATGGAGSIASAVPTAISKRITVPVTGFVTNLGTLFDFSIHINTFNGGAADAGSYTGYVDSDRLTFAEYVDLTTVQPRGTVTIGALSVQGSLRVSRVTASGIADCDVNAAPEVNGGSEFTFLARDSASTTIGTFDPSPGTGLGTVKVMSFEEHGNTTVVTTAAVTFSAVPSSEQDENGNILSGTATSFDGTTSLRSVVPALGGLANVVAGDIVTIDESSIGDAAVKAGTYLVRHAIPESNATFVLPDTYEVSALVAAGVDSGWALSPWPKVTAATTGPFRLKASAVMVVPQSSSGYNFHSSGTVYVITNSNNLAECLAVEYTAISVSGDEITFTLTNATARTGDNTPLSNAEFAAAATVGAIVSGMDYLPIRQLINSPTNNLVGHEHGVSTVGGFTDITLRGGTGGSTNTWTVGFAGSELVDATGGTPSATELGVWVSDAPGGTYTADSTSFYSDQNTIIYEDVPFLLDLRGIDSTQWDTIHGTALSEIQCLVPGDTLATVDGTVPVPNPGFLAIAGVFLEPSFPRPTIDIGTATALVVDAAPHTLTTAQIGMRDAAAFGLGASEDVAFAVRRIRRFHEVLDGLGLNLAPLRFAYEIRRGTVSGPYVPATRTMVASGTGTQLGGFDDEDVNINPGDIVRILDGSGNVVDEAEIASVINATTITLRTPGFTESPPAGGESFEVYLRQAPVPHEQSNEQLLELITEQVILTRTADPAAGGGAGDGGRVTTVNQLSDNGILNFTTLNPVPQKGDIILVDLAGALGGPTGPASPVENGSRPIGDQSVSTRTDGSHTASGPSELDDNRGWYRITDDPSTTITYLAVSGETEFTGVAGSPVRFGATAPTNQEYVVLPEITGSGYTGGPSSPNEGQMDLRVTHTADGSNSYQDGSFRSIEPFNYKIIRPTGLVSEETVDLALLLRERMLSWIEELGTTTQAQKQGSYYVFQRDKHILDLGSATDPNDGLGVPSNVFLTSLSGLTQYAPFANTSDTLSVLDRRYWVLDIRLDDTFPPYGGTDPYSSFEEDNSTSGYTVGSGRPVEPDLVDEVLDRSDRLRSLRYSWIKFRSNRESGTLFSIQRFAAELPRLLREQEDLLRLQASIDETQ